MSIPAWAPFFLGSYQRPEKPTVEHAYRDFLREWAHVQPGAVVPSVHQVRRFLAKIGTVSREAGRMPTLQTKLIAVAVSVAFAFGSVTLAYNRGYAHGFDTAKTQGDLALHTFQLAQARATAAATQAANDQYAAEVTRANQAEQALLTTRTQLAQQQHRAQEQIDAVTQTYRISLTTAPSPLPRCVFTRGFVRLWNDRAAASADGAGALPTSNATADAHAATDPADALDSGLSQADLLDWFSDYAERTRSIEAQLNAVLDTRQE